MTSPTCDDRLGEVVEARAVLPREISDEERVAGRRALRLDRLARRQSPIVVGFLEITDQGPNKCWINPTQNPTADILSDNAIDIQTVVQAYRII